MIRILHCVRGMNRGGIETFIMNLYRNIDREKVQFDFLVNTKKEGHYDREIIKLGGKIHYVPSRKENFFRSNFELKKFFKYNKEYNIIHHHVSSLTDIRPLKFSKKGGAKVRIVHTHNTKQGGIFLHRYSHKYNKAFINRCATHYFACSKLAAESTFPSQVLIKEKYKIIKNAIELKKFLFNKSLRNKVRKSFNFNNKFIIGNIGRFQLQKNHDFLLDIFQEVLKRDKNCVLMLVGEGELYGEIKKKVEKLGMGDSIVFTGSRSDVNELLQGMDLFILPSKFEGLGMVLVEAQASGLTCFASDKVIPKEVDITGLVNFINLNESPEVWAKKILRLKNEKKNRNIDLKEKLLDYDMIKNSKILENFYLNILKENKL